MPLHSKLERIGRLTVAGDDTLYVAVVTTSGYAGESKPFRLYRSADAGGSWKPVACEPAFIQVAQLKTGPGHSLWMSGGLVGRPFWILSAGAGDSDKPAWTVRTLDPGQTKRYSEYVDGNAVTDFAFDPQGAVYATCDVGQKKYPVGVYRSDDKGATWRRLTEDAVTQEITAIAINGDGHVYYRSTNHARPDPDPAIAINGDGHVYYSTHGGIRRSTDGGKTWHTYAGVTGRISGLAFDRKGHLWVSGNNHGLKVENPGLYRSKVSLGKPPVIPKDDPKK